MPCSYCGGAGHNVVTCISKQEALVDEQEKLIANLTEALRTAEKQLVDMKARLKEIHGKDEGKWVKVEETATKPEKTD